MLEQIAKQVNLKKRVVQVWYQNSRARERKGQYRTSTTIMAGNMMMDSFGGSAATTSMGHENGSAAAAVDMLKSPKMGSDATSTASDLGFLFNTFKQHY